MQSAGEASVLDLQAAVLHHRQPRFPGPSGGVGGFSNASHYSNLDVDNLHFDNRFNPDLAARTAAYQEVQRIVAVDIPVIPLAIRGLPGAIHPAITGVAFTADPHLRSYLLRLAG